MSEHNENLSEYHVTPFAVYIKVFAALITLTVITVAVSKVDFGRMNMVVAMLIATIKASLVMGFFMHLKYENKMNRVIFGSGFFFLIVLVAITAFDIATRIDATPK